MLGITCRAGGLGLDRIGVDVLEELETTIAVRCLEHGDGHAFLAIDQKANRSSQLASGSGAAGLKSIVRSPTRGGMTQVPRRRTTSDAETLG
jgi:hypothetical protein